ncbi:MAG: beta-hydroxyacyl-ACP dehydratase, partial [Bacteroidales bacterium]|nr:beta-hydroxyacyl-ACP dehydratase [Bacteroidales bacterium]
MDKEELKQYLPHREPMLLIDELELDAEGVAHGKYTIKEDEFFCRGHFPGNPIVPGVIQCEIMAQSCALLIKDLIKGRTTLYTSIDNVRFKNIVKPG